MPVKLREERVGGRFAAAGAGVAASGLREGFGEDECEVVGVVLVLLGFGNFGLFLLFVAFAVLVGNREDLFQGVRDCGLLLLLAPLFVFFFNYFLLSLVQLRKQVAEALLLRCVGPACE